MSITANINITFEEPPEKILSGVSGKYTRLTMEDYSVCGECGHYQGVFHDGSGNDVPLAPLHYHCRCMDITAEEIIKNDHAELLNEIFRSGMTSVKRKELTEEIAKSQRIEDIGEILKRYKKKLKGV